MFTITPRPSSITSYEPLPEHESAIFFQASEYFSDTYLSAIHLAETVRAAIVAQIERSLQEEVVAEFGGFLLGYRTTERELYVSTYVEAVNIEESSPHRLYFGSQALLELDAYCRQHKELELVGWFHTHTMGISPYLSVVDLRLHDGFFRKNHQVAIVTDAKTAALETGVFTRTNAGHMNNLTDQLKTFYWKKEL